MQPVVIFIGKRISNFNRDTSNPFRSFSNLLITESKFRTQNIHSEVLIGGDGRFALALHPKLGLNSSLGALVYFKSESTIKLMTLSNSTGHWVIYPWHLLCARSNL